MDPLKLSDYNTEPAAEGSWSTYQAAAGGLASSIAIVMNADAILVASIAVFVTAFSRPVLIAVATVWKWAVRKLEGQPPPPGP